MVVTGQASVPAPARIAVAVQVLGEPRLVAAGGAVPVPPGKQQVLLVALAVNRGRPVCADLLVDMLWGDDVPPSAYATLRTLVSRLRHCAGIADGAWLTGGSAGYALDVPADALDCHRFLTLTQQGWTAYASGEHLAAAGAYEAALALWRGSAFGVVGQLGFARPAAQRLEDARLDAVEDLAQAELALGRPSDALARLEPHVAANPLRERAWGRLMLALYRLGRQAEALEAYGHLRARLAEDLGVDPTPELQELHTAILRHSPVVGVAAPAAPREGRPDGLPAALTAFVGRAGELAAVLEALRSARLVSLVGPGGAGKTRLAVEAAARAAGCFPDGVRLADLTPLRDADLVGQEVARAVAPEGGLAVAGRRIVDALSERLRRQRFLLVLDNCEHVVEASVRLVHDLLAACPDLTVLATSREVLGVPGEVVLRVGGLAASEAAELFGARAAESSPGFTVTAGNADAVDRICRRLDGLPLALELAAARLRHLSATELAAGIEDRLRVLGPCPRTAEARHRSLEAALDWSHDLLPDAERVALRRLAVFPGSFSTAAAAAVLALGEPDALDLVARLVDKSLVLPVPCAAGTRYRLLETVRQYAAARLSAAGETDSTMAAARDYLIAATSDWIDGAGEHWLHWNDHWLLWIDAELDTFRVLLEWSAARGEQEFVLALAAPLWVNWAYASSSEGLGWLEQAVAAPRGISLRAQRLALQARIGLAFLVRNVHGDSDRAEGLLREAIEFARQMGDERAVAHGGTHLAELMLARGRLAEADELLVRSADYYRTAGGQYNTWTLALRAWTPLARGDVAAALEFLRAGRSGSDREDHITAHLGGMEALVHAAGGDEAAAYAAAAGCVASARIFPRGILLAMALVRAAEAAVVLGDLPRALSPLAELLGLLRELGGRRWVAEALEVTTIVLARPRPAVAARCLAASRRLRAEMGEENGTISVLVPHVEAAAAELRPLLDAVPLGPASALAAVLAEAETEFAALLDL